MENNRLEKVVKLDNQEVGVLRINPESEFAGNPVQKSEICIETDKDKASSYSIVVHAGQLFYIRNTCTNDISVKFEAGIFFHPNTGEQMEGPIAVPGMKDDKEFVVEVRIKPEGKPGETAWLRTEGAGNGHGSPTLIIRKPPIGQS